MGRAIMALIDRENSRPRHSESSWRPSRLLGPGRPMGRSVGMSDARADRVSSTSTAMAWPIAGA
jgi:hypothetical protein